MADRVETINEDFHNIRGSFKIAGVVDIGTQASLVRLTDGRFVMLDSYTLSGEVAASVARLTDDGKKLAAILNLHPFHTVHVRRMHARFPDASLYGTARHAAKAPELPWQPLRTEDPALWAEFDGELEFTVPKGVHFVHRNQNVHFASVLVRHVASGTVHVDDTLSYGRVPWMLKWTGLSDVFVFHPTLASALVREAGAAEAFRTWAQDVATRWRDVTTVCAAHIGIWRAPEGSQGAFLRRVEAALDRVEPVLEAHRREVAARG